MKYRFRFFLPLLACVLPLLGAPVAAATLEGARFDDSVRLAGSQLQLNGLGLRAVSIIKGYVAGLYLTRKAATAEEVMAAPGPKRVQMQLLIDAPPQVFNKALVSGIRKNATETELAALRERIDQFESMIDAAGPFHKGDTIDLDYDPAHGMKLALNGKVQTAVVPGADFYNAVLGIFVGERPVDAKMKSGLLGQ